MSIESIKARLAAATPGPWAVRAKHDYAQEVIARKEGQKAVPVDRLVAAALKGHMRDPDWPYFVVRNGSDSDGGIDDPANAQLIARAPTDLELLLAVAEATRRFIDRLDDVCTPVELEDALNALEVAD